MEVLNFCFLCILRKFEWGDLLLLFGKCCFTNMLTTNQLLPMADCQMVFFCFLSPISLKFPFIIKRQLRELGKVSEVVLYQTYCRLCFQEPRNSRSVLLDSFNAFLLKTPVSTSFIYVSIQNSNGFNTWKKLFFMSTWML